MKTTLSKLLQIADDVLVNDVEIEQIAYFNDGSFGGTPYWRLSGADDTDWHLIDKGEVELIDGEVKTLAAALPNDALTEQVTLTFYVRRLVGAEELAEEGE